MPRRHRFLPDDMQAVAVMTHCFQDRLLLLKTREKEASLLFLGVWAHALNDFSDIQLASLITQPNHYHAILVMDAPNPERLGDFMSVVNGNIAREMNRALKRSGSFWQGAYSAAPIAASALESRLKHDLGVGIASGDYAKPTQNPLPNTATVMISEEPLAAKWIRRADYSRALWADKSARIEDYVDHLQLKLVRLVHREHAVHKYRTAMRHLTKAAIAEATATREKEEVPLRPMARLLKTDPRKRPENADRSAMPFACGEVGEVESWWAAYLKMREQQLGALRALAQPLGKRVLWPKGGHRPSAIRMAAKGLASGLAAKAVPG